MALPVRIKKELLSLQFFWFLCHMYVLTNVILYVFGYIGLFSQEAAFSRALSGAILSFVIIALKTHSVKYLFFYFLIFLFFSFLFYSILFFKFLFQSTLEF